MKKSRILAAAMASLALTGALSGCSFDPSDNRETDVYGPPRFDISSAEETETATPATQKKQAPDAQGN